MMNTYRILSFLIALSLLLAACASPTTPQPTATLLPPTVTPTPIPPTPTLSPEQQQKIIVENKIKRHLTALGMTTCENCTIKNLPDNSTEALVQKVVDKDGKEQEIILSVVSADGKETPYKLWKMQSQKIVGTIVDGMKMVDGSGKVTYSWDDGKQEWTMEKKIIFGKDFFRDEQDLVQKIDSMNRSAVELFVGRNFTESIFVPDGINKEKYGVLVGSALVLVSIKVEEDSAGRRLAYLLYFHRKTSTYKPFLFRVSILFDQLLVWSRKFAPNGINSISLLSTDSEKLTSMSDAKFLGLFSDPYIFISSPRSKENITLRNNNQVLLVSSFGFQQFYKSIVADPNFKPYGSDEIFHSVVRQAWDEMYRKYFQSLANEDPLARIKVVGEKWTDNSLVPQLMLPTNIFVEPVFSN